MRQQFIVLLSGASIVHSITPDALIGLVKHLSDASRVISARSPDPLSIFDAAVFKITLEL